MPCAQAPGGANGNISKDFCRAECLFTARGAKRRQHCAHTASMRKKKMVNIRREKEMGENDGSFWFFPNLQMSNDGEGVCVFSCLLSYSRLSERDKSVFKKNKINYPPHLFFNVMCKKKKERERRRKRRSFTHLVAEQHDDHILLGVLVYFSQPGLSREKVRVGLEEEYGGEEEKTKQKVEKNEELGVGGHFDFALPGCCRRTACW